MCRKNKLVILLFLVSFSVFSQENLNFGQCMYLAFKNNLDLKVITIQENIAKENHRSSKNNLLPSINGYADNRFSWGKNIDPDTNAFINNNYNSTSGYLSTSLNLFSGFLNLNTIKAAKQEVEINKANFQKVKNEITIEMASKYINILYLEEVEKANQLQIAATKKQLEFINLKFKEGYVSESEMFKIKSLLANQEVVLLNTVNEIELNYNDLKVFLNIPLNKEISISPIVKDIPKVLNYDQDVFSEIDLAVEKTPSFLITKFEINKAKTNIAIARAGKLPSLSANYSYGSYYSDSNIQYDFNRQININNNSGLTFSLTIPIFNQFQNNSKINVAKLLYQESKYRSDIEQNRLNKVIYKAINDVKMSHLKFEAAKTAVSFSEKSLVADNLKFEMGKITYNDLSITKNNFIIDQANFIKSKYEYIFSSTLINFYMNDNFNL